MTNIAAIHLITANAQIGSPVLSASVLIFGGKKAREDFVVSNWRELLEEQGDDFFSESNRDHILFLINSGAEVIDEAMLCSRVVGAQARHQCAGTLWATHYESHVSHYAYLFALVGQKRDIMLKGFNVDAAVLNAANRFIAEEQKNYPTGASSPEASLLYMKELYIGAKRLLGHEMDSDGAKIIKDAAPKLAAAVAPPLPPLPGTAPKLPQVPLTPPAIPPKLPPLPGQ
nr:MAG: hypothetical protein [Bacteriophage sp.]